MKIPDFFAACASAIVRRVRRPGAYLAITLPIAIPALIAVLEIGPAPTPAHVPASAVPPLRYAELHAPETPVDLPEHSVLLPIEAGETLDQVLRTAGLTADESARLTAKFGEAINLRKLRPGTLVRFHYDAAGVADSVKLKIAGWGEIDAVREGAGFVVTAHEAPMREVETAVSAEIESSLYEAVRTAGETPQLVQQLVDVFQWDVDFFALRRGDAFSAVVVKRFAGSEVVGYGPILAARFTTDGRTYEAFRHQTPDGRAGYYSRNGTPLRKQFLRAPLKFSRITSGFSKRRFHPILRYFRAHHGVDYGAPTGTPVMTTADGVVIETGHGGGEGNFVRIRHSSRIETSYLHLSRFAKGIRRGARVTQGDVIGYVGATGLATAPHLDYRVRDGGRWINPLTLKSITPDPLPAHALRRFRVEVARLTPRLAESDDVAQTIPEDRALF
ncbi:MAG TPA: peptidoglycan DD-metalloendopeptidase family protein [Thermoanaerobaculia bacterium]|nr:peptidoglycan DD-metalloendopeptidase family protein [Thermoanaerobaculia bacterium]